jgi:hypothetical protein
MNGHGLHRAYERGRKWRRQLARRVPQKRVEEMKASVVDRLKADASRKNLKGSR